MDSVQKALLKQDNRLQKQERSCPFMISLKLFALKGEMQHNNCIE